MLNNEVSHFVIQYSILKPFDLMHLPHRGYRFVEKTVNE